MSSVADATGRSGGAHARVALPAARVGRSGIRSPGGRGGASPDALGRASTASRRRESTHGSPSRGRRPPGASTPAAELGSRSRQPGTTSCRAFRPTGQTLYLEVELRSSSEEIERAALLLSPVNPFLDEHGRPGLRFRAARRAGYGAAAPMARRCLARLDEEQIAGTLRVLRVQSETRHVLTQGPVWREAGRAVRPTPYARNSAP